MEKRTKKILDEALALPESEREDLVEVLASTLEEGIYNQELHPDWIPELERRQREIETGAPEAVSWEHVKEPAAKTTTTHNLRIHPEARAEYECALARYRIIDPEFGRRFEQSVQSGLELVVERPQEWPAVDAGRRRYKTRRFPYAIVYGSIDQPPINVLSVCRMETPPDQRGNE